MIYLYATMRDYVCMFQQQELRQQKKVKKGVFQTNPELSRKFNKPKCPMPQRM